VSPYVESILVENFLKIKIHFVHFIILLIILFGCHHAVVLFIWASSIKTAFVLLLALLAHFLYFL